MWCHDTQYKDIQYNDTPPKITQRNCKTVTVSMKETHQYDSERNNKMCWNKHKQHLAE